MDRSKHQFFYRY